MPEDFFPMVAAVTFFLATAAVLRSLIQSRQLRHLSEKQAEVQRHLLDRFQSPQELATYLASDAGQKFLRAPALEKASTLDRVLSAVKSGILLSVTGLALFFLRIYLADAEGQSAFSVMGGLALALGIGFLLSAGATWFLSKRWGLINGAS